MQIPPPKLFKVSAPITPTAMPCPPEKKAFYFSRITSLLKQKDAVLIAHYYTDPLIQELATLTGGVVSDSLEMARFGSQHSASSLVVAGVYFMGETAKILSPNKRVFMPSLQATCSLDLGCPIDLFNAFCDQHPDRTVVVYANTSAAIKARADWVVTSSIALDVVDYLDGQGKKILWAPDKHLGHYIQTQTKADMVLWQGACVVHEEFKAKGLLRLKQEYPTAAVLVHPESPAAVIAMADVVGSTTRLLQAVQTLPNDVFIVATDRGIFYKMQEAAPHKLFLEAPTSGVGATCRSCGHCPWMAMNQLENLEAALESITSTNSAPSCQSEQSYEIFVDDRLIERAILPLERMIHFTKNRAYV